MIRLGLRVVRRRKASEAVFTPPERYPLSTRLVPTDADLDGLAEVLLPCVPTVRQPFPLPYGLLQHHSRAGALFHFLEGRAAT